MPALLLALLLQTDPLAARLEKAVDDAKLKDAKFSICVQSQATGDEVYRKGSATPLKLASNTKIFTTACALSMLGHDFKFRTMVGLEKGELHVFGGGDPNISGRFHDGNPTAIFEGWAKKVADARVKEIEALVLHPSVFDDVHLHPDWIEAKYDQDAWWCAPVGALSLNDNCVDLTYEPAAKEGDACVVTVRPETAYIKLINKSKSAKNANPNKPFGFVRREGTNEITVNGELQLGTKPQKTWVAIRNPTRFFGTVLKETLERSGIAVKAMREDPSSQHAHLDLQVLAVHESDLLQTIKVCNTSSQNFYAEMITKMLGCHLKDSGTTEAGLSVIREWLKTCVGIEDVSLSDGCGLSRENRGSAASVAKVLNWLSNHKEFKAWRDSLAVPGSEGTLKRRMPDLKDAVRAKTGHISGVSTLSGYVESKGGATYIFSILVNGWEAGSPDRLQDRICEILARDDKQ